MGQTTDEIGSSNERDETLVDTAPVRREEPPPDATPEAAHLRTGIERTRADMSETIDALQEKLDPARIAEQVKEQIREKAAEAYDAAKQSVKEATIGRAEKIVSSVSETVSDVTDRASTAVRDTGSSLVQYIRENPIPFALVGLGVGMLTMNRRRPQPQQGYYRPSPPLTDRARSVASDLTETARNAAERASTAVSSAADSVRETVGSAVETTRQQLNTVSAQAAETARTARDRFTTTLQENPLALGVAALAAGAIVGLSVPSTRVEDEYMGEARDRLIDQAKSVAQETAQKIQHVAAEAGSTVKEVAQREGLLSGESQS